MNSKLQNNIHKYILKIRIEFFNNRYSYINLNLKIYKLFFGGIIQ